MDIEIKKLPEREFVYYLYDRYHAKKQLPEGLTSSHWKIYSDMVKVDIDKDGRVNEFFGAGLGNLLYTNAINRCLSYICNISYLARLNDRKNIVRICKLASDNLKKIGGYLSYDFFRQVVSFSIIEKHLGVRKDERFDVLIIGDGYGFLSSLVKKVYPNCRIILVDLGSILLFQTINLQRIFPWSKHVGIKEGIGQVSIKDADFVYCPAEYLDMVSDVAYKLVINIASMQEMNQPTIRRYFEYIRTRGRKDNLFYCCNREHKVLPGGEVLEFMKYPWEDGDRHIVDNQCDFYKYFLTWRPPFIQNFDGIFRHRLTNMKIREEE